MAVFTSHNLYPGTIDTAMPGFLTTDEKVDVYFDFSPYNDPSEVKQNYVQVSVRYQNNNLSALKQSDYPSGIILKGWQDDSYGHHYFTINAADLEKQEFSPFQYYKVQFRLTDIAASDMTSGQTIDNWLSANSTTQDKTNLDESTEWSTICLVRGLTTMNLEVEQLTDSETLQSVASLDKVTGYIGFTEAEDGTMSTEYLRSVQIKLYDSNNNLIKNSGEIICNNYQAPNRFNYSLDYNFLKGSSHPYKMEITCVTDTLYTETYTYNFYIEEESAQITFNPTLEASSDEETGFVKLKISYTNSDTNATTLKIYRTYAKDNYAEKKEIYSGPLTGGSAAITITFVDSSVESGILYKYSVRATNNTGSKISAETVLTNPVGVVLNHAFLKEGNRQLKIKFNPQVSSMKTTYMESKTDTLGSQFPYIKRNGAVKYRTFPISGLISYFMDDENLFSSREYEYGDNLDDYNEFNYNNQITATNDYSYERLFRDRVRDFLEDGNVKLFRSATEGNILVRLMEVSFSPNTNNGRMIWTFSATAYEIAEPTFDNMKKYGIVPMSLETENYGDNNYNEETASITYMPHPGIIEENYSI